MLAREACYQCRMAMLAAGCNANAASQLCDSPHLQVLPLTVRPVDCAPQALSVSIAAKPRGRALELRVSRVRQRKGTVLADAARQNRSR